MYNSQIDSTNSFDENHWVVSVLNTGSKLGGHSVLFIEGIKNKTLYLRQYDIHYTPYATQENHFNIKGYIHSIEKHNTYRQNNNFSKKSYIRPAEKVREMIASIKADKKKLDELEQMINDDKITKDKIDSKFIKEHGFFEYQLFGKHTFFSNENDGDNCAGWVLEKLAIVGIGDGKAKPHPGKVAKGKVDFSCNIV